MIEDDFINYKYEQIKVLGEGGYGKVILAENKNTKKKVAIKCVKFQKMDEYDKNKIVQEGQILFKFIHENIIKFEEFSYNNSRAILIMEFAEGGDLNKRINEQKKIGPFKEEIIITWFLELCNVVKYCHKHHILQFQQFQPHQ
jgi:NIMA (never in mitosis gene a)-related kinase